MMGCSKHSPKVRKRRVEGSALDTWMYAYPKIKWVRERREERICSTGWLNKSPNLIYLREGGREVRRG